MKPHAGAEDPVNTGGIVSAEPRLCNRALQSSDPLEPMNSRGAQQQGTYPLFRLTVR